MDDGIVSKIRKIADNTEHNIHAVPGTNAKNVWEDLYRLGDRSDTH